MIRFVLLLQGLWTFINKAQLNLQMVAGRAFQFYTEGPISFPPTYKYNIGRNDYDNS